MKTVFGASMQRRDSALGWRTTHCAAAHVGGTLFQIMESAYRMSLTEASAGLCDGVR